MSAIILVESNPAAVQVHIAALAALGHELKIAQSGEEALALAAAQRPDLIIAIDTMPLVDGVPLLELLNATPKLHGLGMVIFTVNHTTNGEAGATRMYHRLYDDELTPEQMSATVSDVLAKHAANLAAPPVQPVQPTLPSAATPAPIPPAVPAPTTIIRPTNSPS